MKKIIFFLPILALFLFGCSSEEDPQKDSPMTPGLSEIPKVKAEAEQVAKQALDQIKPTQPIESPNEPQKDSPIEPIESPVESLDPKDSVKQIVNVQVLDFTNASTDSELAPLGKGLRAMLETDLNKFEGIQLIEREKLKEIKGEISLSQTKWVDQETAAKVGRLVGATHVLGGTFTVFDDKMRIDSRLIEVQSGKILLTASSEGSKEQFFDLQWDVVKQMTPKLGLDLSARQLLSKRTIHTDDYEAFSFFSLALEEKDNGRDEEAIAAMRKALEKDTGFTLATSELKRLEQATKQSLSDLERELEKEISAATNEIPKLLSENMAKHLKVTEAKKDDAEYFASLLILSAHEGLRKNHEGELALLVRYWDEFSSKIPIEKSMKIFAEMQPFLAKAGKFFERHVDSGEFQAPWNWSLTKADNPSLQLKPALRGHLNWPEYAKIWPFNHEMRRARKLREMSAEGKKVFFTKDHMPRYPHDYLKAIGFVKWSSEKERDMFFEAASLRLSVLHYYSLMPKAPDELVKELAEVQKAILEKFESMAPELWGSVFVRKAIPALRDIASIQTSNDEKIRINKVLLGFVQHARKDSEGKNTSDDDKQVSETVTLKNALTQKINVTVPGIGTELVFVKPAKYQMGDPATLKLEMGDHYSLATPISKGWDGMAHEVTLTRGFWLGKFEVTRKEWGKIMNVAYSAKEADLPVASVRWSKAREFCRKLTEKERASGNLPDDLEFRLPTEAEWELACRGGTGSSYSFGDDADKLGDYAWFNGQLDDGTKEYDANAQVNQLLPKFILEQRARNKKGESGSEEAKPAASALNGPRKVGGKKPNPYGLYDMHGNVQEMVLDWVNAHPRKPVIDPVGSISMGGGARGGGWKDDAKRCKSSTRHGFGTFGMSDDRGFRLALGHVISPK